LRTRLNAVARWIIHARCPADIVKLKFLPSESEEPPDTTIITEIADVPQFKNFSTRITIYLHYVVCALYKEIISALQNSSDLESHYR
jgi:hypothetical protein